MLRRIVIVAFSLALPAVLPGQTPDVPNPNASDTAKVKVARHRQNPLQGPADEASEVARAMVAEHRATHRRGEVAEFEHRPTWIATPPAQRAEPHGGGAAMPAVPPTGSAPHLAVPAQPPRKPSSPGQSGGHKP